MSDALTHASTDLENEDFVLLPELLDPAVLRRVEQCADTVVASPDEPTDDGLSIWHYPFDDHLLDNVLLSSGIVDLCQARLGTDSLLLNNFMFWVRDTDSAGRLETRFHRDYPDNALVASSQTRDAIGVIIYLNDVGPEDGPTRYLPRSVARTLPIYPRWIEPATAAEKCLDDHASSLECKAGSVLVHSLLGVHRGSRPTQTGRRVSMHLVVRRADAHWMGWTSWPRYADSDRFRRSFRHLDPAMKALLGWPTAAWSGWVDTAVGDLVSARFGLGPCIKGVPDDG